MKLLELIKISHLGKNQLFLPW